MIYTPPTFSDHIAVSLVLHDLLPDPRGGASAGALELGADRHTRSTQPFRKQRRIGEMFARSAAAAATARAPRPAPPPAGGAAARGGGALAADAELARRLQARLDQEAVRGRPRRRGATAAATTKRPPAGQLRLDQLFGPARRKRRGAPSP